MKRYSRDAKIHKHIVKRINDMNKKYNRTGRSSQGFTKQSNEKILEQESVVLGKK